MPEKSQGRDVNATPSLHRLDEFPVGYSWRVALQHGPRPLHQPRLIMEKPSIAGKNYFYLDNREG